MNRKHLVSSLAVGIAAIFFTALVQPTATGQDKPKADPGVVIPEAKDIAEIRLHSDGLFPQGKFDPKKKFDLKLTREGQMKPVLDWLKSVEWDKSREDITKYRITANIIVTCNIAILKKDKTVQTFELQPDRIMYGNYRWPADTKKLDAAFKGLR